MRKEEVVRFCGLSVSAEELELIRDTVEECAGLSQTELAYTICELLDWRRPNGGLKAHECRTFLQELASSGLMRLPGLRGPREKRRSVVAQESASCAEKPPLEGNVQDFGPVWLERVEGKEDQRLWREWVGLYHYLGFKVPFGAHLRYFIRITRPAATRVGCMQLSSPAWRMAVRDRWIGWDEAQKARRLQLIVQNSRFLILPWVHIKNLASTTLALVARQIPRDWHECYAIRPVLLETLVDPARYRGSCYIAANWIHLGRTTGRGRMDRAHELHGASPKEVFIYPLCRNARKLLLEQ